MEFTTQFYRQMKMRGIIKYILFNIKTKDMISGYKIARAVCKSTGPDEIETDESNCDPSIKPEKVLMPCNTHSCTTK